MKPVLLAAFLLLLGLAAAPVPLADAYHGGCQPDYPCEIRPCDQKCIVYHAKESVACVLSLECIV